MKKKRILVLCYEYPPIGGGGSVFIKDLLDEISQNQPQISYDLITYGSKKFVEDEDNVSENVHRVGNRFPRGNKQTTSLLGLIFYPIFAIPKALKLSRINEYDVVYSFFTLPSGFAGLIISKILNMEHYQTVIGGDIYKPTKKYSPHKVLPFKWTVQQIINRSHRVNAISTDVKQRLENLYKIDRKTPVSVNNIGLPLDSITSKNNGEKFTKFTYISVGRLDSRKCFDLMIKAFSEINSEIDKQLLIIGDGPEKKNLQALINKLGLEDQIKLLGFVSEQKKYENLARSDCFVLSSYHEGFGLVYIEALQNSTPVISTSNGGVEDIIKQKHNGLLSPINDQKALTDNMELLINNKQLLKYLASNSKGSVQRFDITDVTNQYLEFMFNDSD